MSNGESSKIFYLFIMYFNKGRDGLGFYLKTEPLRTPHANFFLFFFVKNEKKLREGF